jgi:hypothetical protein
MMDWRGCGVINVPQYVSPPRSKYFSFSDCRAARNGGTFCLASISRCFKSSSTDSSLALFIKVVAIPVLPERPVRPMRCTAIPSHNVYTRMLGISTTYLIQTSHLRSVALKALYTTTVVSKDTTTYDLRLLLWCKRYGVTSKDLINM